MSTLKVLGVGRHTLCPLGATVLRVKSVLVHRAQLSLADVCLPRVDSESYMKAMRARTNVVVFLVLLLLTSLVLAPGGAGWREQHAVLRHTHQPCLVLRVPIALLRGQDRSPLRCLGQRRASSSNHVRIVHHSEAPAPSN